MKTDFTAIDYNAIKEELKQKLSDDGILTDYSIISSNTDMLLSTLSMLTTMINHNINFVSNEAFLETAQQRKNIIKHANALGYRINRKVSAKIVATCTFTLENNRKLVIPKWTEFITPDGTKFLTQKDIIYINTTGSSKKYIEDIELIEGEIIDYTSDSSLNFTYSESTTIVTLKYTNIENSGIYLYTNKNEYNEKLYLESTNIISDIVEKNNVFSTKYDPDTEYVNIVFLDKYGIAPYIGDDIKIYLLLSKGSKGNNYIKIKDKILKDNSINVNDLSQNEIYINITIKDTNKSYGGADEESSYDIKKYAPQFKNTEGRIVTSLDWKAYLSNFPQITSPKVYGGETIGTNIITTGYSDSWKNRLKKPGYVFISGMPASIDTSGDKYFSINDIEYIKEILRKNSIIGIRRVFVQPYYMGFNISANISINPNATMHITDITKQVSDVIDEYVQRSFDYNFKKSKLLNLIFALDNIDDVNIDGTYISNTITSQLFYNTDESTVEINLPYRANPTDLAIEKIETLEQNIYSLDFVNIPDGINTSNEYDFDITVDRFLDYLDIKQMNYDVWSSTETYPVNFILTYNGNIYKSLSNNNINNTPSGDTSSTSYWEFIPKTSNYMAYNKMPIDFSNYKRISLKYTEYEEWDANYDGYPADANTTGYKKDDIVSYIVNSEIKIYKSLIDYNTDTPTNVNSWEILDIKPEEAAVKEHLIGVYMIKENKFVFNSALPYKYAYDNIPDYDSGTTYNKGDIVQYPSASGTYYICRKTNVTGVQPDTSLIDWTIYDNTDKFNINIHNVPKIFRYTSNSGVDGFALDNIQFQKETVAELQSKIINVL